MTHRDGARAHWLHSRSRIVALIVAIAVFGAAGAAFAYWDNSQSVSVAGTGATLANATNFEATSPTVTTMHLSWTAPSDLTGYTLSQSPGTIAGCSPTPSSGTTSCDATGLSPNTSYTWTLKTQFRNWLSTGAQVTQSTLADTTQPSVSITNPTATIYNSANDTWQTAWTSPIAGTASDDAAVQTVTYTLQAPGGGYWNGTNFTGTNTQQPTGGTTTSWNVPFSLTNFSTTGGGPGTYTLTAKATDT
jgi:hypothetical protein